MLSAPSGRKLQHLFDLLLGLRATRQKATSSRSDHVACENCAMTKADLHQLVDRLPERAVDGAAILLEEISDGRIDPDEAGFWTREWQDKEREADADLAAGRLTRYENDEEFLAAFDERLKPLDADPVTCSRPSGATGIG